MRHGNTWQRVLSLIMAAAMLAGFAVPVGAAGSDKLTVLEMEQVDNEFVTAGLPMEDREVDNTQIWNKDETVRVAIRLETPSALEAGFEVGDLTSDASADYRDSLAGEQARVQKRIEQEALGGKSLNVVWNLTLAANIISAYVLRSDIERIAAVDGVAEVVELSRYDVMDVTSGDNDVNMSVSGQMTGSTTLWESGYTGAGRLIAVIDTGLDTDHQSFDPDAFLYSISEMSEINNVDYAQQLLKADDIARVLEQLNAYKRDGVTDASSLYVNAKVPFGYNYVDTNTNVTHDLDSYGSHGSHVAGIAAANRYLKLDGEYVYALDEVNLAGNAADAQLLVMKVFGEEGGAWDDDILAAIEDALVLGADAINMSLGSSVAGRTYVDNDEVPLYQAVMDSLVNTETILSNSAGNYGYWAENTYHGYLFSDDANFATGGTPGTYENSLSVASVDNDGTIGGSLIVDGHTIGYMENLDDGYSYYGNSAMTGLDTSADLSGTDYEFVLTEGFGTASDYEGVDLQGKVVFVSRGGGISFVDKANTAASLGVAAVVIYDNTAGGALYMDLTGYLYTAPVVSISRADGLFVLSAAEAQQTESGLAYYTGSVTVVGAEEGHYYDSEYKTMSSFSSWGVPTDLTLKPEITAPGGNIWSVNGVDTSGTAYEFMSGTSMAAPQISGMSALLLQYLEENGLKADDLNARGLAQSLLMATAEPLRNAENGNYYSVMQQGAGMADVSAAINTPVYITVDGIDDGKVKAELHDDAERTGVYTFSFALNNLSDEAISYQLSADLFTQDVFEDENGTGFLDTLTRTMDADVEFYVNGKSLSEDNGLTLNYDFNGDGRVTRADGQHLLDHVVQGVSLNANSAYADISGDGNVDTYDVHLFLNLYQSAVEVPASGSVTVSVVMTLSQSEKARLDQENPAGAYVEAYVFAEPVATEEGELLPTLSIPVLGYYGGWYEPSMFDETCYTTYFTGEETREPYWLTSYVNGVGVTYGDNLNTTYYFGGNPIVSDDVYMPERNAVNLERGDYFAGWDFGLIRNAGAHRATVVNTTTGDELFYEEGGVVDAAYYSSSLGGWLNVPQTFILDFAPEMNEGESGLLTFEAVVDLYADRYGNVDWSKADVMEMPFVVDNTAPVLVGEDAVVVDHEANVLRVTVSDNQYVAGVVIYDVTGRNRLAVCGADQDAQPGETVTLEVSLDGVDGYKFVIQIVDYAVNITTYKLKETIGDPDPLPTMLYYSPTFHEWEIGDWPETTSELVGYEGWFTSDIDAVAATAVGSYIFFVDDAANLYAAPGDNLFEVSKVCTLEHQLVDMTYDEENGVIYGIYNVGNYDSMLVSIDRLTGAMTEIGKLAAGWYAAATLAYVGDGVFYTTSDSSYPNMYTFTLTDGVIGSVKQVGYIYPYSSGYDCLEYNPNDGMLYFVCNNAYSSSSTSYELHKIDLNNLPSSSYSYVQSDYRYFYGIVTTLVFPDWSDEANAWFDPNGEVSAISLNKSEAEIFVNKSLQLTAQVSPWNATDKGVVFSSDNTAVATVSSDGLVTGVSEGTAVITAACTADPSITAQCTVTVSVLDITVEGVLVQDNGSEEVTNFFTWEAASGKDWVLGAELEQDAIAVTAAADGSIFIINPNCATYELDADGKVVSGPYSYLPESYYKVHGLVYSQRLSTEAADWMYYINGKQLLYPRTVDATSYPYAFSLGYDHSYLAAAASGGTEVYTSGSSQYDSDVIYLVDNQGMIYRGNAYTMSYSWGDYHYFKYSKTPSTLPSGLFASKDYSSMVVGDDGALYLSAFTGKSNTLYRLTYNADDGVYEAMELGAWGEGVYPAALLRVTSNAEPVTAVPEAIYEATEEKAEPQGQSSGSLQNVTAPTGTPVRNDGIVVDKAARTITVPIYAVNTTNGLAELKYDSSILTLKTVTGGGVMFSYDGDENGLVRVGFADAGIYNGLAAKVVFTYDEDFAGLTALRMTEEEDGQQYPNTESLIYVYVSRDVEEDDGQTDRPGTGDGDDTKPELRFDDVTENDWFYDNVMDIVGRGYMNGVSANLFNPNGTLTRGMIVTILYRMEGEPASDYAMTFEDVAAGTWYTDAVRWAASVGIVEGYSETEFGPNDPVTRQQLATILWRYAKFLDMDVSTDGTVLPSFVDRDEIASWAGEAVSWACSRGIIQGKPGNCLEPNGCATRAEAATMLVRFLDLPTGKGEQY